MPTYDYECQACGHAFELFQSMTAKVLRKCPACGKQTLKRLIGPGAGFLFKGDGFYITDYRSDSYRASQKAAESTGKGEAGGGDAKGGEAKSGGGTPAPPPGKAKAKGKDGSGSKKKRG